MDELGLEMVFQLSLFLLLTRIQLCAPDHPHRRQGLLSECVAAPATGTLGLKVILLLRCLEGREGFKKKARVTHF